MNTSKTPQSDTTPYRLGDMKEVRREGAGMTSPQDPIRDNIDFLRSGKRVEIMLVNEPYDGTWEMLTIALSSVIERYVAAKVADALEKLEKAINDSEGEFSKDIALQKIRELRKEL